MGENRDGCENKRPRLYSRALVIGGTQFMGRVMVDVLLQEGMEVTVLNRGKTPSPFGERVHYIHVDRLNAREEFQRLLQTSEHGPWDVVVDFVCFSAHNVDDAVAGLAGRVGHYIFISSDSVYMACQAKQHAGPLLEEDAVRPESKSDRKALKRRNEYQYAYGGNKLTCEEHLAKAWREKQFPYTALRLPDVIGPYDNLGGFLRVQQAITCVEPVGTTIDDGIDGTKHRVSLVYAPDVARAVLGTIQAAEKVLGQALHIAHDEMPTFVEFVRMIAKQLCMDNELQIQEDADAPMVSVTVGPISNARAKGVLQWQPTPLAEAVTATVAWNLDPENAVYTLKLQEDTDSSGSDSSSDSFMSDSGSGSDG